MGRIDNNNAVSCDPKQICKWEAALCCVHRYTCIESMQSMFNRPLNTKINRALGRWFKRGEARRPRWIMSRAPLVSGGNVWPGLWGLTRRSHGPFISAGRHSGPFISHHKSRLCFWLPGPLSSLFSLPRSLFSFFLSLSLSICQLYIYCCFTRRMTCTLPPPPPYTQHTLWLGCLLLPISPWPNEMGSSSSNWTIHHDIIRRATEENATSV